MTVDEAVEFLKKSANGANVEISMKVIVTRPVRFSASKRMEYMQNVLDLVESEYEVNEAMIKNADRKRDVVEARQILFYILKTSRFYF
jgi:chromosomal replication initiation ATPase DnaA